MLTAQMNPRQAASKMEAFQSLLQHLKARIFPF